MAAIPFGQQFYLVVSCFNDPTSDPDEGCSFQIWAAERVKSEAARKAKELSVENPEQIFVVMEPEEAFKARPRVAERIFLNWPAEPAGAVQS